MYKYKKETNVTGNGANFTKNAISKEQLVVNTKAVSNSKNNCSSDNCSSETFISAIKIRKPYEILNCQLHREAKK